MAEFEDILNKVRDYIYWRNDNDGVAILCGDAREILPLLPACESIITDPVWPNSPPGMFAGGDDPYGLFSDVARHFPAKAQRVVITLGCDSDPRFLMAIPPSLPFLRACWLEYVRPHYKGRVLYTSDLAYVFGEWPPSRPGARVLPGKVLQNDAAQVPKGHPCPRQLQHVRWLVKWWAGCSVIDPFMGSGTTLLAAREQGVMATGVEISERYCELAKKRLQQGVLIHA